MSQPRSAAGSDQPANSQSRIAVRRAVFDQVVAGAEVAVAEDRRGGRRGGGLQPVEAPFERGLGGAEAVDAGRAARRSRRGRGRRAAGRGRRGAGRAGGPRAGGRVRRRAARRGRGGARLAVSARASARPGTRRITKNGRPSTAGSAQSASGSGTVTPAARATSSRRNSAARGWLIGSCEGASRRRTRDCGPDERAAADGGVEAPVLLDGAAGERGEGCDLDGLGAESGGQPGGERRAHQASQRQKSSPRSASSRASTMRWTSEAPSTSRAWRA